MALARGRVLHPGRRGGPGSFPRAPAAALKSLRQRAPAPASLPIGAGELGTLSPASPPAFRPPSAPLFVPAAGGTPVPSPGASAADLCIGAGREGLQSGPRRGPACEARGRKVRTRGGEGLRRPGPKPEGRARQATRHPRPAAWLRAGCGRAECLCAPGLSGRLLRSCSGHPGRQVRTLRAPSEHRPLLSHSLPAAARAPVLRSRGARQGHASCSAPAWARALSRLGLVPMSCALGTTKCFQRSGWAAAGSFL